MEIKEIREKQSANKERIGIYGKYAKDRDLSYDEVKKRNQPDIHKCEERELFRNFLVRENEQRNV